jgi:hypothetical protein
MVETELEKAFQTLNAALNDTEAESTEEIKVIEEQINELKERIVELSGKRQTLAHDRQAISDMVERYLDENGHNK